MKFLSASSEKPCPAQLKLGLRLYTNHLRVRTRQCPRLPAAMPGEGRKDMAHLPGYCSRILRAK